MKFNNLNINSNEELLNDKNKNFSIFENNDNNSLKEYIRDLLIIKGKILLIQMNALKATIHQFQEQVFYAQMILLIVIGIK